MYPTCKTIGCRDAARHGSDFCLSCDRTIQAFPSSQDQPAKPAKLAEPEYTGGSVSYYSVPIKHPMSGGNPYAAECGDIIEALAMDFNEGNAFKAIWRKCAARTLGLKKQGYKDGLYDAEKVQHFGGRMVVVEERRRAEESE